MSLPSPPKPNRRRWRSAVLLAAGCLLVPLVVGCERTTDTSASTDRAGTHEMSAADWSSYWNSVAGTSATTAGVTRRYFIRAEEVAWQYAPTRRNEITGQPFGDTENVFVATGPGRIGATYLKCLYRQYTDATFTTLIRRSGNDTSLGVLGPVIRAQVGDVIDIRYRNGCRIPTSMHPHGVFYDKGSEGAPYNDGTSGRAAKADDAVPPGGQWKYVWKVPRRAGPGPGDGSSVMWMYHSHTDEVGDTNAGLMGPMVITAAGKSRPDGSPADIDQELFSLYTVMNENSSPYLQANVDRYAGLPQADPDDEDFQESNLMHSINGYVYGSQPMVTLRRGQHVRWYTLGMGTEVDLHTPHWHGNVVTVNGMRTDVVSLLPASMVTADMVPDNPGVWLFHCHVNDHISAGMMSRYQVIG
ncbi:MAG: multicopper oxidase domain-containing protein [Jatrophihabitantaceae bacterium]